MLRSQGDADTPFQSRFRARSLKSVDCFSTGYGKGLYLLISRQTHRELHPAVGDTGSLTRLSRFAVLPFEV